jgi:hypothetical protein
MPCTTWSAGLKQLLIAIKYLVIYGAFEFRHLFRELSLACQEKTVHQKPANWIDAMLSHRIVLAEIKGKHIQQKGCLQEGVFPSLFWSITH